MENYERRLWRYVRAQWRPLAVALACSAGATLVTLYIGDMIKRTIDAMTDGDVHRLNMVCLTVVGVFAVKWFFSYGQVYYMSVSAQRMLASLRADIFAHLQRLPLSFFNKRRVGAVQSVIINDVPVLQSGVQLVRDSLDSPLRIIGGLGVVFFINWRLALLACLCLPMIAFVISRIGKQIRSITHLTQGSLANITAVVEEVLAGIRTIKSFAMEDREIERFAQHNRNVLETTLKGERRRARLRPTVEMIGAMGIAAVLWFGGQEVAARKMTTGQLFQFLFVLQMVAQAANGIGNIHVTRKQALSAAERIFREALDAPLERAHRGGLKVDDLQGRIEFQNVSFAYPDGSLALDDVSFVVEPGEIIGLVGRSGSGKSTLVDLLLGFYEPTAGRILIDGKDLKEIDIESLRSRAGVAPQHTVLFVASVADNIAYGKPGASREEIEAAARAAHAHEFIERLPDSYDSLLGDKGARLSGGENQRIAIARALLRDPKILILDEATSALDSVSERLIQQAILEGKGRRTTIVIAHRLSTVQSADRLLALDRGRLVETGAHADLLAKEGYYARLYRSSLVEQAI
ncbi:MAG: ABC transporter ATP-binding protein [Armatimonadetes bacterium]|nr:ABC transporter ATP-binding protein [Armatimonadota bacterium]